MKNLIQSTSFIMALMLAFGITVFNPSQAMAKKPKKKAKKKMTYTIAGDEGTNGCAIAYNPDNKMYYTVIAGNAGYPLCSFNKKGISTATGTAGCDSRGLWWNSQRKKLEGNGPGDLGFFAYRHRDDGSVISNSCTDLGKTGDLPSFNMTMDYDAKNNRIVGYYDSKFYFYSVADYSQTSTASLSGNFELDNVNATTVCYTGMQGYDYALLDFENKKVLYFDLSGKLTGKTELPADAVTHDRFRWSFANNMVWLYDVDTRTWTAYKV